MDGGDSDKINQKPSKSSLIFITTFVNTRKTKILIDTGATTTFINTKFLQYMKHLRFIHHTPYSLLLADGLAPFYVLGVVELSIQFANTTIKIQAHIAKNLCADMIIGMDYINLYNLNINIKRQVVSIHHHNHTFTMNIDKDFILHKIPVTLPKPMVIPPHSNCSTTVSIPVSSIFSLFVPTFPLHTGTSLCTSVKFLNFRNYSSSVTFSNTSSYPQFIRKGVCVCFMDYNSRLKNPQISSYLPHKSFGVTGSSGQTPVANDFDIAAITSCQESFGTTGHPVMTPETCGSDTNKSVYHKIRKYPTRNAFCNTVTSSYPIVEENIRMLVQKIDNQEQRDQLYSLLVRFYRTFDTAKHNIATTRINHVINTIPHSSPACRLYPQPDKEEAMYKLIQEFLQAGLIRDSHSSYAAPAILVKKKDGSFRFVVDYKKLNFITIKDSSPLPNMEDAIRKLGQGYSFFSKLDLKSGFYQISINENDKEKTAFVTPFGLYQFNVLPMGLKNSPPTFQKVMTDTLRDCRQFSLVYLDDIIVFSKSSSEHISHLQRVLLALQAKNLILNPPKCDLAVQQINYLGHTISKNHVTPMKEKIAAILQISEPRSLAQANRFIGALGWYRKFLPKFATVAAPIHAVTNFTKRNRHKFRWRFAQSRAFHELKNMLITEPLFLHYPVPDKPLILTTDASGIGIGGSCNRKSMVNYTICIITLSL